MKIACISSPSENIAEELARANIDASVFIRGDNNCTDLRSYNPDILLCRNRDDISSIIDICPNIKMIFIIEVGLEHLPFSKIIEKEIRVANTGGISTDIMSNYVLACILNHAAKFREDFDNQQKAYWKKYQSTDSLNNKTLLIVGAGKTGIKIAEKAKPFGLCIKGIVKNIREIDGFAEVGILDKKSKLIADADYLVCTLPLTKETHSFFSKEVFRLMKPSSVFINVSRGGLVVEKDLAEALKCGNLSYAYLDVFEIEPLPSNNSIWKNDKITITPHQSGRLADNIRRSIELFNDCINAFCEGEKMPTEVDLTKGY